MLIRLKEKIEKLHATGYEDERIIELITNHTQDEIDYEVMNLLARAYLNFEEFEKALVVLESLPESYQNDPYYCFRRGAALMLLKKEPEFLNGSKKRRRVVLKKSMNFQRLTILKTCRLGSDEQKY